MQSPRKSLKKIKLISSPIFSLINLTNVNSIKAPQPDGSINRCSYKHVLIVYHGDAADRVDVGAKIDLQIRSRCVQFCGSARRQKPYFKNIIDLKYSSFSLPFYNEF